MTMKHLRFLAIVLALAGLGSGPLWTGAAPPVAVPADALAPGEIPEGLTPAGWSAIQAQVTRLIPSDGAENDEFGYSVAVDGDTAIVGAHKNTVWQFYQGAAYVFYRNQGGPEAWGQVARLTAADGAEYDSFGSSVAIAGDTVIVGADFAKVGVTHVGVVYVFYRNQGGPDAWGQVAKLTAVDGDGPDSFGSSVSLDGETAVVGASAADGVQHKEGAAYVFYRNQGGPDAWGPVAKLFADDGVYEDAFGMSVSVDGDTAIIGAGGFWQGAARQGAAYVFYRDEGGPDAWGQVVKLTAADGGDEARFGWSVSIDGDTAVVGAEWSDVGSNEREGAAYVFYRDQGGINAWGQVAKLIASDGAKGNFFGESVAVSGDTAVVGSPYGDQEGTPHGAAYVFYRDQGGPNAWWQVDKVVAEDDQVSVWWLGCAVAVSGDLFAPYGGGTAVVGAYQAGVNGNYHQGAAYVYVWRTMHLGGLQLAKFRGPWPGTWYILAGTRVHDGERAAVPDVVVTGDWSLPDGQVRTRQGVTNDEGLAWSLILSSQAGQHEFCVTDLTKEGYYYRPEGNEWPVCETITVGP
jgi:hypothetical protein